MSASTAPASAPGVPPPLRALQPRTDTRFDSDDESRDPDDESAAERLMRLGCAALRDEEVLGALVDTHSPHASAVSSAEALIASAGGMRALFSRTPVELAELVSAMGDCKGASGHVRIVACAEIARRTLGQTLPRGRLFRSSRDVFRHYAPLLRDLRVEQFRALFLDGKHRVIREELISQGTLTSSPVHPREVFGPAMRHAAAAVVLVHNHPSGDPTPSGDDLDVTRRLRDVGHLVGIQVLDHVIVGDGEFASLADRGLL